LDGRSLCWQTRQSEIIGEHRISSEDQEFRSKLWKISSVVNNEQDEIKDGTFDLIVKYRLSAQKVRIATVNLLTSGHKLAGNRSLG
jgi:hypothetical protein